MTDIHSHTVVIRPSASRHTLAPFSKQILASSIALRTMSAPAAVCGSTGVTDCSQSPISLERAMSTAEEATRPAPTVPFRVRLKVFLFLLDSAAAIAAVLSLLLLASFPTGLDMVSPSRERYKDVATQHPKERYDVQ